MIIFVYSGHNHYNAVQNASCVTILNCCAIYSWLSKIKKNAAYWDCLSPKNQVKNNQTCP